MSTQVVDPRQYKRLEYSKTYEMYVLAIIENRRQYVKDNKIFYIHDIHFVDNDDVHYKPEYVSSFPTQSDFVVGKKAKFICTLNGRADEITPCAPGMETPAPVVPVAANPFHIAGTAYSQGLAMAVQIACAECTVLGKNIDMEAVFKIAGELENWLMDKKETYG